MEIIEEVYEDFQKDTLGCDEAAALLGCSVRQLLRLRQRYEEAGLVGLRDRRLGRPSPHRAADSEVEQVTRMYREKYQGFSVKHFHEILPDKHAVQEL